MFDRGIIWPKSIAPFQVVLVPVNAHKSIRVKEAAEEIYQQLLAAGVDILIDDRPNNGAKDFEGEWIHFGEPPFCTWKDTLKYLNPR